MSDAVVQKLMDLSKKPEDTVTAVLSEIRAEGLRLFGNKNSRYKEYVSRKTYVKLGIKKNPPFKPK